jgi:hypothetical protein
VSFPLATEMERFTYRRCRHGRRRPRRKVGLQRPWSGVSGRAVMRGATGVRTAQDAINETYAPVTAAVAKLLAACERAGDVRAGLDPADVLL